MQEYSPNESQYSKQQIYGYNHRKLKKQKQNTLVGELSTLSGETTAAAKSGASEPGGTQGTCTPYSQPRGDITCTCTPTPTHEVIYTSLFTITGSK